MTTQMDMHQLIRDDRTVAAFIDAERVFGVFKRTMDVPAGWVAIASLRDGGVRIAEPGRTLDGGDVSSVLLVTASPFDVRVRVDSATSADKYLCDLQINLTLQLLTDRDERDAFRQNVLQSRTHLTLDHVAGYLSHAVDDAVRTYVVGVDARDLIDGDARAALAAKIADAVKGACFTGGLELEGPVRISASSEGYHQVRSANERAARRLGEHQAQRQLSEALQTAHQDRVSHLEGMLARLNQLAVKSPDVGLPELMRAFDQTQRSQLYQALFSAESARRVTQWLAVAAGNQVLFFDPASCRSPVRTVTIDGVAGALRSVEYFNDANGPRLMLGAADGVYVLSVDADQPDATYLYADPGAAAGGVNAVAVHGDWIVATHSARGVTAWRQSNAAPPISICQSLISGASAIRGAQFCGDRFYCSIDARIVSLPACDLCADPHVLTTLTSVISAMTVTDDCIYAGTADGEVIAVRPDDAAAHQVIHAGSRRAVESIHLIERGPVSRLFYTDTTLAVFSRVIGDSFTCRYEAGGQTLRRVEPASDYVAATNDARDRIILFATSKPEQPAAVIPVTQQTGRSIQDACLIPLPVAVA